MKEHLGIVTNDTSASGFSFFVTPLRNKAWVGEMDFVIIEHPVFGESSPLIAVVREIKNYEEVVGTTVNEKSVQTTAAAEILGYVDLGDDARRPLHRSFMAPIPGSKVYLPYSEFLEDFFLRDLEGKRFEHALHVGSLESHAPSRDGGVRQLGFFLDAEDFVGYHFLVAGLSGAGKTHTATVIVEELAHEAGWPVVVLDSYGEYATLGLPGKMVKEAHVFSFGVSIFSSDPPRVADRLKKHEGAGKGSKYSVKAVPDRWLKSFDEKGEVDIKDDLKGAVKENQVTIIDSTGLSSEERRSFFTNCVRVLWRGRAEGSVKPFLLVVEDAEALEAAMLEKIASEGRKSGVTLCLLSQHPCDVSSRVLSQMGFQFMGRTTDSSDLERLRNMAGEKLVQLPQLTPGEWIVSGVTLRPTKVLVRNRHSIT